MPLYNFKQNTKLLIVYDDVQYKMDLYPDVSFSQTFNESAIPVKTLHNQYDMLDDANITTANPANFNFTIPLLVEEDLRVIMTLLMHYDITSPEVTMRSCDMYFVLDSCTYVIKKAVIERGTFQIVKDRILSLSVSGTGSKLSLYSGAIPGVLEARSSTTTYVVPNSLSVSIDSLVRDSISAVTVEVSNEIQWLNFDTLHDSLKIVDYSGTMYPSNFYVAKRTVSGTIQQYLTDTNQTDANKWKLRVPIKIRVGASISSPKLEFNFINTVYTNRLDLQDLYYQTFDFRVIPDASSDDMGQIIYFDEA